MQCLPCGATRPWVPPVLLVGVLLVAIGFAKLNSSPTVRELSIPLSIGLVYLQLVAFLRVVSLWWPSEARAAFSLTALASLNLSAVTETQCFVSFEVRFVLTLAFPLMLGVVLLLTRGLYHSVWRLNAARPRVGTLFLRGARALNIRSPKDCQSLIVKTSTSLLSASFMFLVWESVVIFDCIDAGRERRMRAYAAIVCGSGAWYKYLPIALLGMLFYIVGIPALLCKLAYSKHVSCGHGQQRAHGCCNARCIATGFGLLC